MSIGAELIRRERQRQVQAEGWTLEHDDAHDDGSLARAAIAYASAPGRWSPDEPNISYPCAWPWDRRSWKPSGDAVVDLTKAGALIAAEIDRRLRAK